MYEHIIVPFDGSPRAKEAALFGADVGKLFGARLHLVTSAELTEATGLPQLKQQAVAMSDESVDVWVEPDKSPAGGLATVIAHRPNSLVCMSTTGRSGLMRAVYGSVAEDLVRQIDAPIIMIGPKCDQRDPADIRQLVVCVDSNEASSAAVVMGADWAAALKVPITLLHVRPSRTKPGEDDVDLQPFVEHLLGANQVVEEYVVADDDTPQAILNVLAKSGGAMAVMATHARSGLSRVRRGSVLADVVRRSTVPVLVRHAPDPTKPVTATNEPS